MPYLTSLTLADSHSQDWMFVQALAPSVRDYVLPDADNSGMMSAPAPATCASHDSTAIDDVALLGYLESYFGANHCILPILDRTDVLERLAKNEHYTDQRFLALIYSIVVVSEMIDNSTWPPHRQARAKEVIEYVCIAQSNFIHPASSSDFRLEDIATCLNLNYVWSGMSDRRSAWFWIQQALSIGQALMIDEWDPDMDIKDTIPRLKAFYCLVIIERTCCLFASDFVLGSQQGLRLPGNIWENTEEWRDALPPDTFSKFPLAHVKLLSLITPEIITCWRRRCSTRKHPCTRWTVPSAIKIQQTFAQEVEEAMQLERTAQHVKVSITGVWIQDRLWNLCRAHGLVKHDHPHPELSLDLIIFNLVRCSDYCATVTNKENFQALDLSIKIADLVMTAITIMSSRESWMAGSDHEMLSITFRPLVDRFIGLLMAVSQDMWRSVSMADFAL